MTSIPCLAKKDLSHVNLATADLHGADLHEATLRHATLKETNLEDADLTEADLTHANLGGASLRNATAAHANFEDADLRDADLTGANLRGARLTGAKLCDDQRAVAASAGADLDDAKSEDTDSRRDLRRRLSIPRRMRRLPAYPSGGVSHLSWQVSRLGGARLTRTSPSLPKALTRLCYLHRSLLFNGGTEFAAL